MSFIVPPPPPANSFVLGLPHANSVVLGPAVIKLLSIPVEMPGAPEERRGTSWARATRELRRLRHRIEAVGGSQDQWEAGVWHMENEQWDLQFYYGLESRPLGRRCPISLLQGTTQQNESPGVARPVSIGPHFWGSITGDPSISPSGVRCAEGLDL
jgi:hypothetical protein